MAGSLSACIGWLDAVLDEEVPAPCVFPFLDKVVSQREEGWFERVLRCLRARRCESAVLRILLTLPPFSDEMGIELIGKSRHQKELVECLCRSELIPAHRIRRFLEDSDESLVAATVSGIWESENFSKIDPEIAALWRRSVCRCSIREYQLCEMLKSDSELAYAWLLDRSTRNPDSYDPVDNAVVVAAEALTREQRSLILGKVSAVVYEGPRIAAALVGDDKDLYRELLRDVDRKDLHLAPLRRKPDAMWAELAIIALEAGFPEKDIAIATFLEGSFGIGSIADQYEEQVKRWEVLNITAIRVFGRLLL